MHIVGPNIDDQEVGSFSIRQTVDAIPCPEGAAVTDKDGNQLATYADKCYVVVDGDQRFIVSAYVFDGLYTETSAPKAGVTTSQDIAAAHETAAATSGQPVAPSHGDLVAGLRELDADKLAELRAALDEADPQADPPAETASPSSTPDTSSTGSTSTTADAPGSSSTTADATPAETSTAATPSVADLSTPSGQ